jgi:hypothetical protein
VPVCPCPGECVNEGGLAMIDMTYNSYIDTGNSYIMQMKSNLLTLYETETPTPYFDVISFLIHAPG